MGSEVTEETWKKKAEEAEKRAREAEGRLEEANRCLDAERVAFEEQAQKAAKQVSEAEDRTNRLRVTLAESGDELRKTVALLDMRSAELRDAQAYLTRIDDIADAEVLHLVEGMNSRIFQTAASIADAFRSRYGEQKDIRMSQEAAACIRYAVGDDLFRALRHIDRSEDSLVQTVLQAAMVSYAKWLCATWDFEATGPEKVLQNVYHFIRRTGTYFELIRLELLY